MEATYQSHVSLLNIGGMIASPAVSKNVSTSNSKGDKKHILSCFFNCKNYKPWVDERVT